ncbi:Type 1 glutamine amidotransferase-like domain-containing protein [Candidatus Woesebacteria bacterium]|nr:Type 1 glutamine amidotransferase-like domain-containing protein [Candidatus Woesebacteria bacterium]
MKLLLCSEGFTTEEIITKCEELVGKPRTAINVAVINEAYAVEHENNLRWVLENLNTVDKTFGGKLELVNLLGLDIHTIKERIEKADIIYVVGGHTDYLMSVFNKTGFSKILPELLKTKIYVGSSAGSMVLGKRLSAEAYEMIYGEKDIYGNNDYLGLVDFSIMPHLDSPHFANRKEKLLEASKQHKGIIYALRDDTAIIVNGNEIALIGSEPLILNN